VTCETRRERVFIYKDFIARKQSNIETIEFYVFQISDSWQLLFHEFAIIEFFKSEKKQYMCFGLKISLYNFN